ncbi:granzyme G-like [Colossoma macropomum]|uniref:granzyme G-like n=1 Tax=Colossoma macropomum TaxID=42526 RepID=UPI0018643A43|nr:granzyme G-like [Colossoma macropomum]
MALISLLLLAVLLPYLSHSASVNVGIINGTEAKPHSRPYMVSVQEYGSHVCGKSSQLRGKAKQSKTVNWISIPKTNEGIKANSVCSVAGWGKTGSFKSGSNRLLETKITIVAEKECKKLWKEDLTPRMICAVHPGGTCEGDSGGALVCGNTAVGIVSFGQKDKCDAPTKPEVFAKISAFLPWIKSIIGKV